MAETSQDCLAMMELADSRGLILMVGHTFLFNPAVRQIKRYIDEGELGKLLYVYFQRTGLGPIRQDVNALWDLAPHDISMMRYWTGEDPIELEARGQAYLRPDLEDVVFLTLHYPRKLMASIHVSWLDPVKVRRATIVGDRKMAVFDDVHPTEKLRVYDKGASYQPVDGDFAAFVASVRDGEIVIPRVENQEPLTAQVSHFIDCIETGRRPLTDGHDGLAVVRVLERAQNRLESSRLPRPALTADFREVASSR
jgi:predicted dehydrogenase